MKQLQYLLIYLTLITMPKSIWALSCAFPSQQHYDLQFDGEVIDTVKVGESYKTNFKILIPLKGNLAEYHEIYHRQPLPPSKTLWINASCNKDSNKCSINRGPCSYPFRVPKFGKNPLHHQACNSSSDKLRDYINTNILSDSEQDTQSPLDQELLTVAIMCKNEGNIKFLLDNYPDLINYHSPFSPAMLAIEKLTIKEKTALSKIFAASDLTKNEKTPNHDLQLNYGVSEYRGTVCEEINTKESSALQFAIGCASQVVADLALKHAKISDIKKNYADGLLNFTLRSKNADIVLENFTKLNPQINKANQYGHTPLLNAIIAPQKIEIIDFLIKSGADINLISEVQGSRKICRQAMFNGCKYAGKTNPVHMAVETCNPDVLQFLIDNGADLNAAPNQYCQNSLLNRALEKSKETCSNVADILFQNNLKLCRKQYASIGGIFEHALKSGNPANLKVAVRNTAEFSQHDLQEAITTAVYNGSPQMVKYLLDIGANPNEKSDFPLITISNPHNIVRGVEGNDVLRFTQTTQVLIKYGADVNAQDKLGNTALHNATRSGSISLIKTLLNAGASKNIKNRAGQDAIDMIETNFKNTPFNGNKTDNNKTQLRKVLIEQN